MDEKEKMEALLDFEIGSEIAELELLAASCRVPSPTTRIVLTEDEERELEGLDIEPSV
jgi:hypothetical protein